MIFYITMKLDLQIFNKWETEVPNPPTLVHSY